MHVLVFSFDVGLILSSARWGSISHYCPMKLETPCSQWMRSCHPDNWLAVVRMTTVRGGKFPLTCGFRGIDQWSVPCFIVLTLIWGRNILMLGEHSRGYKTHDGHQSGEKERWGKAGGAFQRHTPILTYFREAGPTIKIYWCMDFFMTYPIVLIRALVFHLSLRSLTLWGSSP